MDIDISLKILTSKWKISIPKKWVQFGIVVMTVLISTIVAFWGSMKILMLIPVLLGGIAVGFALFKQFDLGFILLFLASMFVPFTGPGGINAAALMVVMLIGLWFMDGFVVKRHFQFIKSRTLLPIIVFAAISLISFAMGQVPWFLFAKQAPLSAQIGGFAIYILSLGMMLVTAHT
jgi:hypothetical protein